MSTKKNKNFNLNFLIIERFPYFSIICRFSQKLRIFEEFKFSYSVFSHQKRRKKRFLTGVWL